MDNKKTLSWVQHFEDKGVSPHLIEVYKPYVRKLTKNNVPVIFEINHLSVVLGIKYNELVKIVNGTESYYRTFSIKKRKGGVRTISSPYPSLLLIQRWIYDNVLKNIPISKNVHSYTSNKSIISNAEMHLNKKCILKMDLEDFFGSIPINWVVNLFSRLGYADNISYALASLCCLNDSLPQGGVTSPCLSNVLLKSLDKRLFKLSQSYSFSYSRYADDIVFSGDYIPNDFISIVTNIVTDYGLKVNEDKTSLIVGDKKKIVTGICVHNKKLTIPRNYKRELKKEVYFITKYGLISHISKKKIKDPNYILSIQGKLRFWLQVEPDNEFARKSLIYFEKNIK